MTGLKLTISHWQPEKGVFVKSYEGEHTITTVNFDGWKVAMNEALMSMIKEISTDLELIEFLNENK